MPAASFPRRLQAALACLPMLTCSLAWGQGNGCFGLSPPDVSQSQPLSRGGQCPPLAPSLSQARAPSLSPSPAAPPTRQQGPELLFSRSSFNRATEQTSPQSLRSGQRRARHGTVSGRASGELGAWPPRRSGLGSCRIWTVLPGDLRIKSGG